MNSNEHKSLRKQVLGLTKELINFSASSTGEYSEACRLKFDAFVVLFHSEVESYFEDLMKHIVEDALRGWKDNCILDRILMSLIIYHFDREQSVKKYLIANDVLLINENINFDSNDSTDKDRIGNLIKKAVSSYRSIIDNNHGIMNRHTSKLFDPLGISDCDLDQDLFRKLEAIAARRNKIVHRSRNKVYDKYIDPFEHDYLKIVDDEISSFEKILSNNGYLKNC